MNSEAIQLTNAVKRYIKSLESASPVVNRTHLELRTLREVFGVNATDDEIDRQFTERAHQASKIECAEWDSFSPQPLTVNGVPFGVLMPRMTQAQIAATPGIQGWSAPLTETRRPGQ